MVAMLDSPYEMVRQQRMEENQKRMQELGICKLSENFRSSLLPPATPSVGKTRVAVVKEKVKVELRRSLRKSASPRPEYAEIEVEVRRRRTRVDNAGGPRHYSRLYERKYASDEARAGASNKAEAIKERLPLSNPSFVKPMLQSHVTGGFWLGLPVYFCRDYLPKDDTRMILEDEKMEEWETAYLANRTGLSAGWRGFSLDHGLVDGDALVFELVQPHRFKVHIVRGYELDSEEEHQTCYDGKQSSFISEKTNFMKEEYESDESAQQKCRQPKTNDKQDCILLEDANEEIQNEDFTSSEESPVKAGIADNETQEEEESACKTKRGRKRKASNSEMNGKKTKKLREITSYMKSTKLGQGQVLKRKRGRIEGC